jgi:hypothetical protein
MARCKAHESCPREGGDPCPSEAYTVRRSDGTCPAEGGGDECNAADGRF